MKQRSGFSLLPPCLLFGLPYATVAAARASTSPVLPTPHPSSARIEAEGSQGQRGHAAAPSWSVQLSACLMEPWTLGGDGGVWHHGVLAQYEFKIPPGHVPKPITGAPHMHPLAQSWCKVGGLQLLPHVGMRGEDQCLGLPTALHIRSSAQHLPCQIHHCPPQNRLAGGSRRAVWCSAGQSRHPGAMPGLHGPRKPSPLNLSMHTALDGGRPGFLQESCRTWMSLSGFG